MMWQNVVYRGLYSYRQEVRVITRFPNIFFVLFLHINPIQTGGGLFEPPLRQNRDNFYTERAMTFKFSDFSWHLSRNILV